jgi:hypothetical protein
MNALAAAVLAGLALLSMLLVRRTRALLGTVAVLEERVSDLSDRLRVVERDAAGALERTEVAEAVLLDKGLADEEDLEAARRRFDAEAANAARDGDLH